MKKRLPTPFSFFLVLFLCVGVSAWAAEDQEGPESACISCHSELGGTMAEPVTLWETSIHRPMGNNCEGCHGGDPNDPAEAMNPARGFVGVPRRDGVAAFCGKCHVGVKENYLKSVHAAKAKEGAGPTCVTCHHSHDVKRASFELISEELCSRCHSYANGRKMKQAFVTAEVSLQKHAVELSYLGRRGMPVKKLEARLFALRNALHQMTHTLDLSEIEAKTGAVLKDLEAIAVLENGFRRRIRIRWWGGVGIGLFLSVLIVLLIRLHKSFKD